jgi:hypothetical protein
MLELRDGLARMVEMVEGYPNQHLDELMPWSFRPDPLRSHCESLSGYIPRSSLRSSDLLPFYHQYPAACCGDFLLRADPKT